MNANRQNDELILIDLLLGRCDEQARTQAQARLRSDTSFRRLHKDIANALAALGALPAAAPPEDLAERTMLRIHQARAVQAQRDRQQLGWRVLRPTFSLRELSAVAAVVVLLVFIFVPSVREARHHRIANICASQIGQIGSALQHYANANSDFLPSPRSSHRRWLPAADEPATSNSAAMYLLVKLDYARPVLFQCPAVGGESFVVRPEMTDFPGTKYISYSYQHSVGRRGLYAKDRRLITVAKKMVILADSTPVFENGLFHRDRVNAPASYNHNQRGQNVLFLDMHVDWADTADAGVDGDNIFLAKGVLDYSGVEVPAGPTDTFLLPAYSGGENTRR